MKPCLGVIVGVTLAAVAAGSLAQTRITRPIRLIVPYVPGGATDTLSRFVGPAIGEEFGQQVVIDNRAGGSSTIGTGIVARATPDGHTIGMIDAAFVINPSLFAKLPYSTEKDMAPVSTVAWFDMMASSQDPLFFAIVDNASGDAIGSCSYLRIDAANGVIEVGWLRFSPRLQRTPAGTESQYLLMRRAFEELGYRRYEWKCDSLNAPSRAAALRYGFTYEGLFRQAIIYKGRTRDTTWYSIIDREWPAVKAAFAAWLKPDNFDAAGRQRRSLVELRRALPSTPPTADHRG